MWRLHPGKDRHLKTAVPPFNIQKTDVQALKTLELKGYNIYNDRMSPKVLDIYTTTREINNLSTKPRKHKSNYRSPSLYYE